MSVYMLGLVGICYALTAWDLVHSGQPGMGYVFTTYALGIPGFIYLALGGR